MQPEQVREKLVHELGTLQVFYNVADFVIDYVQLNTQSVTPARTRGYSYYDLIVVNVEGRQRQLRPVNKTLFVWDRDILRSQFQQLERLLTQLGKAKGLTRPISTSFSELLTGGRVNAVMYTLMQSVACGLDLFTEPQFARKNVGTRFEDFICALLHSTGVTFKRGLTVAVPVGKEKLIYHATSDLVISPFTTVKSSSHGFAPEEIIVSVKTSSKDRMKLIFTDRYLLTRASSRDAKVIALFLNDVQRMGQDGIASTFVADLFLVFCNFFGDLNGVYFIDPPRHIGDPQWGDLLKRFDTLITKDLWSHLALQR